MQKVELLQMLANYGLPPDLFVGETPVLDGNYMMNRAAEIYAWLDAQPSGLVDRWVALDDLDLFEPRMLGHFVHTDSRKGLSDEDAAAAQSILGSSRRRPTPLPH